MGEKHIQHPGARTSPLCLSGVVPSHSSSFFSFHVDGWSYLWLWERVSLDSICSLDRCYSSFPNRTSLPPQDASKHHPQLLGGSYKLFCLHTYWALHDHLQEWLKQYPKKAAILRAAGEGTWFHQFQAVTLIRVSPFPYMIYNYCALATGVHYGPYILGSLVGMVPEIFVSIYTYMSSLSLSVYIRHVLQNLELVFFWLFAGE